MANADKIEMAIFPTAMMNATTALLISITATGAVEPRVEPAARTCP